MTTHDPHCQQAVFDERTRIRSAVKIRCPGLTVEGRCGLNRGHVGGCSPIAATITITRSRLEEILEG